MKVEFLYDECYAITNKHNDSAFSYTVYLTEDDIEEMLKQLKSKLKLITWQRMLYGMQKKEDI